MVGILIRLFGFIYFCSCLGSQIAEARWVNSPANDFGKILIPPVILGGHSNSYLKMSSFQEPQEANECSQ